MSTEATRQKGTKRARPDDPENYIPPAKRVSPQDTNYRSTTALLPQPSTPNSLEHPFSSLITPGSSSLCGSFIPSRQNTEDTGGNRRVPEEAAHQGLDHGPTIKIDPVEVCFGMVCGVRAIFFDTVELGKYSTAERTVATFPLECLTADYFVILSTARVRLGVIDTGTAKTLSSISDLNSIRFEVLIPCNLEIGIIPQPGKSSQASGYPIMVNIYGSHSIIKVVGKQLSDAKVYLQQPDYHSESAVYDNPHYFKVPGEPTPAAGIDNAVVVNRSLEDQITDVFDSLGQPPNLKLPMPPVDSRIKTDLLMHQKVGMSFIAEIEDCSNRSLWLPDQRNGRTFYRHLITGSPRESPLQGCRGGIVADDMGLGKTLTILASVVQSLRNASTSTNTAVDQPDPLGYNLITTKATLIIVPLSLLDGWVEEIEKHIVKGTVTYYKYHGKGRETNPIQLKDFDIILTTYSTVSHDYLRKENPLGKLSFYRIVLDEAHVVRQRTTKQFKAVDSLMTKLRWCVTGTPVHNRLEDIETLIKLLRCSPFDDSSTFRKFISDPLKIGSIDGLRNLRSLLGSICLRRTQELLTLPPSTERLRMLDFSPEERRTYKAVVEESKNAIESDVCDGNSSNAYHKVLQAILQLRMLCNHGTFRTRPIRGKLSIHRKSSPDIPSQGYTLSLCQLADQTTCDYCGCPLDEAETATTRILTTCFHSLCPDCLLHFQTSKMQVLGGQLVLECSLCQNKSGSNSLITTRIIKPVNSLRPLEGTHNLLPDSGTSTKISALLKDIEGNADEKSVVFSYWTKSLDLVGSALSSRGVGYVRLDGTLPVAARAIVIARFRGDQAIKVLLMTTGAGAVGLNLTIASRVHLLEPQWNPMVDMHAIGRVRRLGQTKPVSIFRYIMKDSIEESVQLRQMKKLHLAELTCDETEPNATMVGRILDLRALL